MEKEKRDLTKFQCPKCGFQTSKSFGRQCIECGYVGDWIQPNENELPNFEDKSLKST